MWGASVTAFWISKSEVEGNPKVLENFHVVFAATQLHPDTLFFSHFLIFSQSWQPCKNKKLQRFQKFQTCKPLSLKISGEALAILKQIHISTFSLHTPYPHWNLNIFHKAAICSINRNQGKNMFRNYIPGKVCDEVSNYT